ncbi:hypothetical protein SCUCBS95973_000522 [Sporothrix curviconia]|uniref:Extracellular membrane protein CFEM domain-containing protein n=1 Tax=Sporothrix curviconia TaxID=1260050 RepID=A0ABP0AQZ4_9PEZI
MARRLSFSGCLGLCVANSGCGSTNTHCVCSASSTTSFLDDVIVCVAKFCLLSSGSASADTTNNVIAAIDQQFLEVVDSVCAKDQISVPASKISAALSTASSIVSEVLGATGTATLTTLTTHATTTVYRSTQTTKQQTTKTVPRAGTTTTSTTSTTSSSSSTTTEATSPSSTSTTSVTNDAGTGTTAVAKDTTTTAKASSTAKTTSTATKPAPAEDTTDGTPFTNTNESAGSRHHGPAVWKAAAAATVPMLLTIGVRLL